jgi:hypothetical protein
VISQSFLYVMWTMHYDHIHKVILHYPWLRSAMWRSDVPHGLIIRGLFVVISWVHWWFKANTIDQYIHMYIIICIYIYMTYIYIYIHISIYTCIYICLCIHICITYNIITSTGHLSTNQYWFIYRVLSEYDSRNISRTVNVNLHLWLMLITRYPVIRFIKILIEE